jgi:hypothetical protein
MEKLSHLVVNVVWYIDSYIFLLKGILNKSTAEIGNGGRVTRSKWAGTPLLIREEAKPQLLPGRSGTWEAEAEAGGFL